MKAVRFLAVPIAALGLVTFTAPGCGGDDGPPGLTSGLPGRADGGATGDDDDVNGICLLNNCDLDRDCANCADSATHCDQSAHRCIACGADANNATCGSGKTCTKYGACVSNGVSCAEDANGVPTITCKNTADCGACGPKFRVCDTGSGKCVGCSSTNTTNCQSTDVCDSSGTCAAKCPTSCNTDSDCGNCGSAAAPAHACNAHVCSTCSATTACAGANVGDKCDLTHGTCVKQCGLGRPGVSNCSADGNCAGCTGTTKCDLPVNSSGSPDGTCAAPAAGCSSLGKDVVVLPAPFDEFTQACSTDTDCANQQISLDVGKILKDATGLSAIASGNINYSEHSCADIPLPAGVKCGVCVPCKTDTDCADIDITSIAGQLFGPIGTAASSILLDKAFGPNDHKINMFCQNVADDYGVCLPCPSILTRCAQTGDNVPATGTCSHDICSASPDSTPLNKTGTGCTAKSACIATVCDKDPYCCVKSWDSQCVADVDLYCSDQTCTPDSCAYRGAGWYCDDPNDAILGAYRCDGDGSGTDQTIAEGLPCPTGSKCTSNPPPSDASGGSVKATAVLCDTDGTTECPTGNIGKPKCVATTH